ncbi:MAG: SAM-dependent methyltransferase [Patescibacteria group bacterium]|jgi:23S rRNA (cytosine1962-C5)-methyltransferase|nr:SAM-dependent methyltransferase [Patescibacteria group bacterium]
MILKTIKSKDYELLDSGNGLKLERYGEIIFSRPDPEALWNYKLPTRTWDNADAIFIRRGTRSEWNLKSSVTPKWDIDFGGYKFIIKPTSFKHVGLFPEQLANWDWMKEVIKKNKENYSEPISVLNLFGYTGGATLACADAGAEVTHVDGSKTAVAWARENAELSGMSDKPIRWIIEDCIMYLKREVKRGRKYDAVLMDPPAFGHGPKDELWKIEEHFMELIDLCKQVLSDKALFVLINGYTAGYSPTGYENVLKDMMRDCDGKIEIGELTIAESNSDRLLPCGIFARWERN